MKLKVTSVEEIEVELQFPVYRKSSGNCIFYKVLSEQKAIVVSEGLFGYSIEDCKPDHAWNPGINPSDCEESEFNEVYLKAIAHFEIAVK